MAAGIAMLAGNCLVCFWGAHQGHHATTRLLEVFLEFVYKKMFLGRVLRRRLVRVSEGKRFLEGVVCHRRHLEGT